VNDGVTDGASWSPRYEVFVAASLALTEWEHVGDGVAVTRVFDTRAQRSELSATERSDEAESAGTRLVVTRGDGDERPHVGATRGRQGDYPC